MRPRCGEPWARPPSLRRPRREESPRHPGPASLSPSRPQVPPGRLRGAQPPPPASPFRYAGEARAPACHGGGGESEPTPPPGGMVHPARPAAPSAAAHPPRAEPFRPEGRGVGGGRPLLTLTPPPCPALHPAASRHLAAPRQLRPHRHASPSSSLPLPSISPPALRSPFRRCGAGRRGGTRRCACAPRERTIDTRRKDKTCVGPGGCRPSRRGLQRAAAPSSLTPVDLCSSVPGHSSHPVKHQPVKMHEPLYGSRACLCVCWASWWVSIAGGGPSGFTLHRGSSLSLLGTSTWPHGCSHAQLPCDVTGELQLPLTFNAGRERQGLRRSTQLVPHHVQQLIQL